MIWPFIYSWRWQPTNMVSATIAKEKISDGVNLEWSEFEEARRRLVDLKLIAFAPYNASNPNGYYQVLPVDGRPPSLGEQMRRVAASRHSAVPTRSAVWTPSPGLDNNQATEMDHDQGTGSVCLLEGLSLVRKTAAPWPPLRWPRMSWLEPLDALDTRAGGERSGGRSVSRMRLRAERLAMAPWIIQKRKTKQWHHQSDIRGFAVSTSPSENTSLGSSIGMDSASPDPSPSTTTPKAIRPS